MSSIELILAIKEYAKTQGVDFEIALKMLGMMHEDGIHLEGVESVKTYKVVYNNCFGGFCLSKEASLYLNEKYGFNIDPEYGDIDEDVLPRHHKALVDVVELMGEKANGFCAKLRIAEIHTPMYRVDDYDGNESIETPHSYDWIVIND